MKIFSKIFGLTAVTAVIALVFAGCLSYSVDSVEVSIDGNAASIDAGKSIQFNFFVNASGKDTSQAQRVNWSVSSTSDGRGPVTAGTIISPNGTLSVSADEIYPILYVRATHAAVSSKYDFKQIEVKGPKVGSVVLSSTGNAMSAAAGGTLKLSAFVAGKSPNVDLTYSVGSRSDGTGAVVAGTAIAADGTLTVAATETASSLYVKAVSTADATKFDIKEIKVVTITSVTVSAEGGTARVTRGGNLRFTAAVTGNNDPANTVTWKVSSNAAGTGEVTSGTAISADGTLTVAAAEAAATLYVIATSTLNTTKSGSTAVTIPTVTRVTVSPANPSIKRGEGVTFTARVQGTGDPGQEVTWKLDGVGGAPSATTITANGMLIVSPAETLSGLIVTATSVDDPTKFGTSMITIPAVPAAVVPATPAPQVQAPAATPAPAASASVALTEVGNADFDTTENFFKNTIAITKYKGSATAVIIPATINNFPVTRIDRDAFKNNKSITSVTIPNGVDTIYSSAFEGCTSLTSVTIPNSVTYIGIAAFKDCTKLTDIIIPNGVTQILTSAFSGCTSLKSITIPGKLDSFGNGGNAFLNCTSLTAINVDAANTKFSSENGVMYNKNKTTLVAFPGGKTGAFTIPSNVTSIGDTAFYGCSLTSLTIPSSVTKIDQMAVYYCPNLTSVTFAGTIPSSGFNGIAFDYGSGLRDKFYATDKANGTPGTYTRPDGKSNVWTKQ